MAQKIKWRSCLTGLLLLSTVVPARAESAIPRKILALYDASTVTDVFYTLIHLHAEMPLNYLGMDVVFRDVNQPLPAESDMAGYRGVITWFNKKDQVNNPQEFCGWAKDQMVKGRKLVILGRMGFFMEGTRSMAPACKDMLQYLGVRYMGGFTEERFYLDIVRKDSAMTEFEHKLGMEEDLKYIHLKPVDPKAHVYLVMRRTDMPDSDSALVLTTSHGGFAYANYVQAANEDLHKIHWRIDPFRFFEEAYALKGLPRPDTTTLNGSRIFYSHIDGDGIFNVSHIDNKTYSGEVIYNEILKPFSDIPISASIITGYLDMPQYTGGREMMLYRNIFSLPNVEVTTHGYAHPLIWKKEKVALKIPGYHYSVQKEVQGAVALERELLAKLGIAKPVTMYQWTGDCLVPPEAIESANAAHVVNLNGGDTRFDEHFDSYSFVAPLSVVEGAYRQINASNSNEYTYTDEWKGRFYGYGEVVATFENTETPRRVKPIDVYYHYFSGEHVAALQSLKAAYGYVRKHRVIPIVASRFPPIVTDFFATQMSPVAGGYRIQNQGALRTIRFDEETRNVDLVRSTGVMGFTHERGSLYVTLDDGTDHTLILTSAAPTQPYIIGTTFDVRGFARRGNGVRLEKKGWMASEMHLGGMRPNSTYRVQAGGLPGMIRSSKLGTLDVVFPTAEMGRFYQEVTVDAK